MISLEKYDDKTQTILQPKKIELKIEYDFKQHFIILDRIIKDSFYLDIKAINNPHLKEVDLNFENEFVSSGLLNIFNNKNHMIKNVKMEFALLDINDFDSMYEDSLMMQAKALEIIFKNNACLQTKISHTKQESDLIWSIRRNASQATTCYGVKKLNEDITVPRSNLKALLDGIYTIGQKYGFDIPCFGHAGDGNVHVNVMLKNDDQKTLDQGHSAIKEIFQLAINLEGTLSGEHGIGISKAEFMSLAFNQAELDLMRSIKKAFDPNNILNPHKMGL